MPSSGKIPLSVFQVLEDEYEDLHGPFDRTKTIMFRDPNDGAEPRPLTPTFDWAFHPSHFREVNGLALELALTHDASDTRDDSSENLDELSKKRLIAYLRLTVGQPADETAEALAEKLNQTLDKKDLFEEQRFSNDRLCDETKLLRDLHLSSGGFDGDELRHFNRLLLEDTFPKFIERIHNIRLAAIIQRIHEKKPTALCLSGGGIRSGTFGLGLLQGLARNNLLDSFHYLSTVSGGGYIASWLVAWIHRHPRGLAGVTSELANSHPLTKIDPDPAPVGYLRRYSNFITPKVGLLSADTWTFLGIYLRNLLLNWIVFIPLLLAVLILPRLFVTLTLAKPESWLAEHIGIFGRDIFLAIGAILTVWTLAYVIFNRPTFREELRQYSKFWRKRTTQGSFLRWCLLPLTVAAFCLTTYWARSSQVSTYTELQRFAWFVAFGIGGSFFAWLIASFILGRFRGFRTFRAIGKDAIVLFVAGALGGAALRLITLLFEPVRGGWDYSSNTPDWSWWRWNSEVYASFAVPIFMLVFLLGVTIFIGFSSFSSGIDEEDREWWARLGAWVLIVIICWATFTSLVIFGPLVLLLAPAVLASVGGLSGVLAAIVGRSSKIVSGGKSDAGNKRGIVSILAGKALPVLAGVFIATLLISLSLATTGIFQRIALWLDNTRLESLGYLMSATGGLDEYLNKTYYTIVGPDAFSRGQTAHLNVLHHTSFWFVLGLGLLTLIAGLLASKRINLNMFSLHAGYRNRLIRAFLGASRPAGQRKPNPFTGFDPADNLSIYELRAGLFRETDFLDPVALANALLHPKDSPRRFGARFIKRFKRRAQTSDAEGGTDATLASAVSKCLLEKELLTNLKGVPNEKSPSTRLLTALRKDLNRTLQDPEFHTCLNDLSVTDEETVDRAHIIINRSILERAFPGMFRLRETAQPYRLMPVINTTLNLVGGSNLAWQQRKAEPFSVTPLHSGCFRLGYRDSRTYGGRTGISIGTAAAISGAAASSNMGYYTTSPLLSLVLTFFNVRLGWWLGNSGTAGHETFSLAAPRYSVRPILDEALGMTDDENEYIYLTDGGHFENLGLFEMVLRRCHIIIVSDGTGDGEYRFGDLGNAIRKVRIDLGIPIEFDDFPSFSSDPDEKKEGSYWAVGRIQYSCIDTGAEDGFLLYIKPALYGSEPRDVLQYKKNNSAFPHQTTADQFFDEPQFESYRSLGSHIMDQLCKSQETTAEILKMLNNRTGGKIGPGEGDSPSKQSGLLL